MEITECPFSGLAKRERGRDKRQTTEKRRQADPATSYYYIRWMDDMEMYRERLSRTIRELGEVGGGGGGGGDRRECCGMFRRF